MDNHRSPPARLGLGFQLASMTLDNPIDHGESQAGTFFLSRKKGVKNLGEDLRWYSDPRIGQPDLNPLLPLGPRLDCKGASLIHSLAGIHNDVEESLPQLRKIRLNRWQWGKVLLQVDFLDDELVTQEGEGLLDHLVYVYIGEGKIPLPGKIQKVAHNCAAALGLPLDQGKILE